MGLLESLFISEIIMLSSKPFCQVATTSFLKGGNHEGVEPEIPDPLSLHGSLRETGFCCAPSTLSV